MNRFFPLATLAGVAVILSVSSCKIVLDTPDTLDNTGIVPVADRFKFFIQGKATSNLSEDRKKITLSVLAEDPDGEPLQVEWTQDKDFGLFNSTVGKNVQWTAIRDGTYKMLFTVSVRNSRNLNDPDVAAFLIPVVDGKIDAPEMAPEISLAPQSFTLFRLPQNPPIPEERLTAIKATGQLTATTYIYDPQSNTKIKQSADFEEIKWTSSDPSLVTVDDNGFVKPADGSSVGKTLITASSKTNSSSNAAAQASVQYLDTDIVLSNNTFTISRNGSVDIKAIVNYSNPADRNSVVFTDESESGVTWSSSDPTVAQVDSTGLVTPLLDAATGDIVITAKSNYDPSKSKSVTLKVR